MTRSVLLILALCLVGIFFCSAQAYSKQAHRTVLSSNIRRRSVQQTPTQAPTQPVAPAAPTAPTVPTQAPQALRRPQLYDLIEFDSPYFKEVVGVTAIGIVFMILSLIILVVICICGICNFNSNLKEHKSGEGGFTWRQRTFWRGLFLILCLLIFLGCILVWIQTNLVASRITRPLDNPVMDVQALLRRVEGQLSRVQSLVTAFNNLQVPTSSGGVQQITLPSEVAQIQGDVTNIRQVIDDITEKYVESGNRIRNIVLSVLMAFVGITALIGIAASRRPSSCIMIVFCIFCSISFIILWIASSSHTLIWKGVYDTCNDPGEYDNLIETAWEACSIDTFNRFSIKLDEASDDALLAIRSISPKAQSTSVEDVRNVDVDAVLATIPQGAKVRPDNSPTTIVRAFEGIRLFQEFLRLVDDVKATRPCTNLRQAWLGVRKNNICGEFVGSTGSLAVALGLLAGSLLVALFFGYFAWTRGAFFKLRDRDDNAELEEQAYERAAETAGETKELESES